MAIFTFGEKKVLRERKSLPMEWKTPSFFFINTTSFQYLCNSNQTYWLSRYGAFRTCVVYFVSLTHWNDSVTWQPRENQNRTKKVRSVALNWTDFFVNYQRKRKRGLWTLSLLRYNQARYSISSIKAYHQRWYAGMRAGLWRLTHPSRCKSNHNIWTDQEKSKKHIDKNAISTKTLALLLYAGATDGTSRRLPLHRNVRIREIHPLARLVQNAGALPPSLIPHCKGRYIFQDSKRKLQKILDIKKSV